MTKKTQTHRALGTKRTPKKAARSDISAQSRERVESGTRPVDAEIRRAAERAGLNPQTLRPTVETFAPAITEVLQQVERGRLLGFEKAIILRELSVRLEKAAAANDPAASNRAVTHEREVSALSCIMRGGLTVDDDQMGLRPEEALLQVIGAQVKAVMIANVVRDSAVEDGEHWTDELEWRDEDTHRALAGIVAMAQGAHTVLNKLRLKGDFRNSHERDGARRPTGEAAE